MSSHDRKSASLFKKLLKQNMMTSDSFIKASEAQIIQFNKFLIQEAELQTAALYKRKEMLDEVMSLLHEDSLNQRQVKRVIILLHRLNMKVTANSTIEGLHPNAVKQHTSGKIKKVDTEKPSLKSWTLLKKAEEKRLESQGSSLENLEDDKFLLTKSSVNGPDLISKLLGKISLKHDWKELNDWLTEISEPTSKVNKSRGSHSKKKNSKKEVSKSQVETCFNNRDQTIKKDIGLSRPSANKVGIKAPYQNNQQNVRNAKSKEKTVTSLYGQLPQKQIGANQGKIRKGKSKEKNVFERLYPKPRVPKLISKEAKSENSKKSSFKRTGSFDTDPVKNSETFEESREFHPNLDILNELDFSDTSEQFNEIPLRKLSFVVDPNDSIFFNRDWNKKTEPTRKFTSNSVDLHKVDTKDSFLENSTKTKNDVKTSIFGVINSQERKIPKNKEKKLWNHVYFGQKVSSMESRTDEEELLADVLKFFPLLKEKLVVDDEDCNGEGEDSLDDEIVLYTRDDTMNYGEDVMKFEGLARLEPSLDEILRQEEIDPTQKKGT